jgi:hypothetical protein
MITMMMVESERTDGHTIKQILNGVVSIYINQECLLSLLSSSYSRVERYMYVAQNCVLLQLKFDV